MYMCPCLVHVSWQLLKIFPLLPRVLRSFIATTRSPWSPPPPLSHGTLLSPLSKSCVQQMSPQPQATLERRAIPQLRSLPRGEGAFSLLLTTVLQDTVMKHLVIAFAPPIGPHPSLRSLEVFKNDLLLGKCTNCTSFLFGNYSHFPVSSHAIVAKKSSTLLSMRNVKRDSHLKARSSSPRVSGSPFHGFSYPCSSAANITRDQLQKQAIGEF